MNSKQNGAFFDKNALWITKWCFAKKPIWLKALKSENYGQLCRYNVPGGCLDIAFIKTTKA